MGNTVRVAATLAALTMMSVSAFAQGGGGRPGGGFGGGFGGGQFGRGGMGMGGELTTAQIPMATLTTVAKLTTDQQAKVKAIHDKMAQARQASRPQGGGGFDPNASREEMMERFRQMQESARKLDSDASKAIEAVMTPDQATALRTAMPGLKAAAGFGLLEVYNDLKLTPEQIMVLEKAAKERQARMQGGRRGGN